MYMTPTKKQGNIYRSFSSNYPKHKEVEAQAFIGTYISKDISTQMFHCVKRMSTSVSDYLFMKGKG